MKKIIFGIFLVLLLLAGYFFINNNPEPATKNQLPTPTSTPTLTLTTSQEIQYLLAKKYNKPVDEVKITISKEDGNFAGGSVLFGQGGPGEGGIFLARRAGNVWEVVFDGNGNVDCTKMRQVYGFPDAILKPNFCD